MCPGGFVSTRPGALSERCYKRRLESSGQESRGPPLPASNRRVECVWHSTTLRYRVHPCMPDYRRNRVAGGTYFHGQPLDRDRPLLVEHIELLRESVPAGSCCRSTCTPFGRC